MSSKYTFIWQKSLNEITRLYKGEINEVKMNEADFASTGSRNKSGYNILLKFSSTFILPPSGAVTKSLGNFLNSQPQIIELAKERQCGLKMKNFILTLEPSFPSVTVTQRANTAKIHNEETSTSKVTSFEPIADENSEYLVLGTAPGIESLRAGEYYARKGNRFWQILGELFHEELSSYSSYESKKEFLRRNHIALWDTLKACKREGSSDSAITNEVANNIDGFLKEHPSIRRIIFNGKKAEKNYPNPRITSVLALSTSPANRSFSDNEVIASWKNAFGM